MTQENQSICTLSPQARIPPPPGLLPPPGQRAGWFRPAWLLLCPKGLETAMGTCASTVVHNHYVTHARILNQIVLRVGIRPYASIPWMRESPLSGKTVQAFAGKTIDQALKDELDRQLAFMRRGEDLGENRRRRNMMERYLRYRIQPAGARFYGTPMLHQATGSAREKSVFHTDILHERQTSVTHTTQYKREVEVAPPPIPAEASRGQSAQGTREIAEQVYRRVEQQLRRNRERSGYLLR